MVLGDELVDDPGEAVFAGEFDAVLDVSDDDEEAHGGGEFVVAVGVAGGLVFDEVLGLAEFADVVVVGADAAEEAVGADGVAGGFGHDADGEGVVEGAGGFLGEASEEGLVGVAEFQEGHGGGDVEDAFDGGEDGQGEHGDGDAGAGAPEAVDAETEWWKSTQLAQPRVTMRRERPEGPDG